MNVWKVKQVKRALRNTENLLRNPYVIHHLHHLQKIKSNPVHSFDSLCMTEVYLIHYCVFGSLLTIIQPSLCCFWPTTSFYGSYMSYIFHDIFNIFDYVFVLWPLVTSCQSKSGQNYAVNTPVLIFLYSAMLHYIFLCACLCHCACMYLIQMYIYSYVHMS